MANIFDIEQTLLDIYSELEENGGELTEELENQLEITQADFNSKVQSYTNLIKSIESDIDLIAKEEARLKDLKERKKKSIERLSKIVINAIDMFGDCTKSGTKFIDFGTSKISIRTTKKVEVDETAVNAIAHCIIRNIRYNSFTNQNSTRTGITYEELIEDCEKLKLLDEDNVLVDRSATVNKSDILNTNVKIEFDLNVGKLLQGEGYDFINHLVKYCPSFKSSPKVDKVSIKKQLSEENDISFAKIIENQTLNIK